MTCPLCTEPLEGQIIGTLTACPCCHRTLAVEQGIVRLARGADTEHLTAQERTQLQTLRGPRTKRRAHA